MCVHVYNNIKTLFMKNISHKKKCAPICYTKMNRTEQNKRKQKKTEMGI